MADNLTEINCLLADCMYYHSAGSQPGKALCSHKDAYRYLLTDPPCPIYRMDFQKKMAAAQPKIKPPFQAKRRF
jgi:hypothetical protein